MAEMAVSFAIDQLLPLLTTEFNMLKGVDKEFADIKHELVNIQAFLKDADKRAATDIDNSSDGVKTWVKQLRETAFRIEDTIDDYLIHMGQEPRDSGCLALLYKIAHLLKTMIPLHRIASEIQDIKSSVCRIKEDCKTYGFQPSFEQGSSSSTESQNAKRHNPRMAALYIEETDVVGFEAPRQRLVDWMVKGRDERTVVSVVGMGGQGKTTLAKNVFDSNDVIGHFDCRVRITVSESYNVEGLLRDMLQKIYKQKGDKPPEDIYQMDRESLTDEVRNSLQQKRYVVLFDDVWGVHFWNDIEFAIIDNKNGSRILITTRNMDVAVSFKSSSFIEVLELQPLTQTQSLELFNKKAFKIDFGGCCPKELTSIAYEIVEKCKGLPLAIVAIGGLLSIKEKNESEWRRSFSENLSLEPKKVSQLIGIKEILGLSYDDLPYYLKSCLLYFGIYPEDYEVRSKRMIRQWIAEGFVKEERGKTLEEVAEGYLTELIHRSLVQVSSLTIDGKAKCCRVHDLIRDMILEKFEDLNFCKHVDEQSSASGIIRRLSIKTSSPDLKLCIERSHVRSIFLFNNEQSYESFQILTQYKLLKVLDCESFWLYVVPENLGNLMHLKYLSFRDTEVGNIPKSIGMLQNLETLDVRDTHIRELPKEISKLKKIRHLLGNALSLTELKDGIREMTSLQTLCGVDGLMIGAEEVIKELGKLKQIRHLRLNCVRTKHGSVLSSSINKMQHLEKLFIESLYSLDIDLQFSSLSTKLQKLTLSVKLKKMPEWIPKLQNIVVLKFMCSRFTEDPLQSLKRLQHLLYLSMFEEAYEGLCLHFEDGGFQKLKELYAMLDLRIN